MLYVNNHLLLSFTLRSALAMLLLQWSHVMVSDWSPVWSGWSGRSCLGARRAELSPPFVELSTLFVLFLFWGWQVIVFFPGCHPVDWWMDWLGGQCAECIPSSCPDPCQRYPGLQLASVVTGHRSHSCRSTEGCVMSIYQTGIKGIYPISHALVYGHERLLSWCSDRTASHQWLVCAADQVILWLHWLSMWPRATVVLFLGQ